MPRTALVEAPASAALAVLGAMRAVGLEHGAAELRRVITPPLTVD
jgi:hypothetical protein